MNLPADGIHIPFLRIIFFLLAISFTIIFSNIITILVTRIIKDKISKSIFPFIKKSVFYLVFFLGLYLSITKIIKLNIPAVLTALGVFGAFCFVPTIPILQNVISGIVLVFIRPFSEVYYICLVPDYLPFVSYYVF